MAFRLRKGARLLAHVIKQFDKTIADLDQAALDIQEQRDKTRLIVANELERFRTLEAAARAEDAQLAIAQGRALTVSQNIGRLVAQ